MSPCLHTRCDCKPTQGAWEWACFDCGMHSEVSFAQFSKITSLEDMANLINNSWTVVRSVEV